MRNRLIAVIGLLISLAPAVRSQSTITTVAGVGLVFPTSGSALSVNIWTPSSVFKDSAGNMYISLNSEIE
jgi:hypothetical protein